jgi:hypothetical protein
LQPLASNRVFEIGETGNIATRPRQAGDVATAYRIRNVNEYNWNRAGRVPHCIERGNALSPNHVGRKPDHFCREHSAGTGIAAKKTKLVSNIVAVHPSQLGKLMAKCGNARLHFQITFGKPKEPANEPHAIA